MELRLYNTLTRSKDAFVPIEAGKVGLYTCGFTVYDYAHIGNLRSYIFADILKRALIYSDYKVNHIENITDVGHLVGDGDEGEDKMEVGARKSGKSALEIAKYYTEVFKNDLEKSNVLSPTIWAPATEFITEQIEFIKNLEEKGFAYKITDGLYFDTSKLSDYGKLAMLDLANLKEGARLEKNPEKRNPTDFCLWRAHDGKREMKWESPWGVGIPGWHIECSTISTKFLGERFDIHTGGIDHIPVHHTNEIAQNEARFGHKVVNFWLHNDFMTINGSRMAKSVGNIYTLDDVEKRGFSPMALRYLYLGTHYRQKLNFTWEALESAQNSYNKLVRQLADGPSKQLGGLASKLQTEFESAIADDLNTPRALAELWEVAHNPPLAYQFDKVLGLGLEKAVTDYNKSQSDVPIEVSKLASEREEARKSQDWIQADILRERIASLDWSVEDSPAGQRLTHK
ncbi:MAG: cysteine--tRNA ligase [Patescibacteria group bacterium]